MTVAIVVVLASPIITLLMSIPIGTHVARWDQPPDVVYGSNEPYFVEVVDFSSWWNVFHRERFCQVRVIANLQGSDGYGHYSDYQFHNYYSEPGYIHQCTLDWMPDGITIIERSAHKFFIPKSAFVGGR